jgi:hypothetical protein
MSTEALFQAAISQQLTDATAGGKPADSRQFFADCVAYLALGPRHLISPALRNALASADPVGLPE